jgi:hypothetical protein
VVAIGSFYGPIGKKKDEERESGRARPERAGFALIVTTNTPLLSPSSNILLHTLKSDFLKRRRI